jgi:hypothetical protein
MRYISCGIFACIALLTSSANAAIWTEGDYGTGEAGNRFTPQTILGSPSTPLDKIAGIIGGYDSGKIYAAKEVSSVPEPPTFAIWALGACAIPVFRRSKLLRFRTA